MDDTNEEKVAVEIPLSITAIRLLKAYATLSGKTSAEVSAELGDAVSDIFEAKLKRMVANEIGMEEPKSAEVVHMRKLRPQPEFDEDIADLGDADEDEYTDSSEIPPSQPTFTAGGLTDKDLEDDMKVEDPLHEAKGEPDQVDPSLSGEDIIANALGLPTDDFVDDRIRKRKKNFGTGRGKVKTLSEATYNEGAGV